MHFCIDRFEYPNQKGVYPWIMVSWYEAEDLCADEGKRICTEEEWTFACEGEEAVPYPYGYTRDASSLHQRPALAPLPRVRAAPSRRRRRRRRAGPALAGPARRAPRRGARARSASTISPATSTSGRARSRPGERPSILKGGYWGPVRTRCRPATRSHDENHMFYQQGVRCCADVGAELRRRPSDHDPSRAPIPRELE